MTNKNVSSSGADVMADGVKKKQGGQANTAAPSAAVTPKKSRFSNALLQTALNHAEATKDLPNTELTSVREIMVDQIEPNPYQPRKEFDEVKLQLLAANIDEFGLIQPIEVRVRSDGRYEIVVGERRVRAHKLLGKRFIRAMVNNITDVESSARSLMENIQRSDLSDFETYMSIKRHKADFPDSTYTYASLGIPKTEYFRLQSFDEFPTNVQELLTVRPYMISGVTAESTKQYIKKALEENRLERKAIDKALKTIIQKAIDANVQKMTTLAQMLESTLEPGSSTTKPKPLMVNDVAVGDIATKGKFLQVRVTKNTLDEEKIKRLEAFIMSLYAE